MQEERGCLQEARTKKDVKDGIPVCKYQSTAHVKKPGKSCFPRLSGLLPAGIPLQLFKVAKGVTVHQNSVVVGMLFREE